MQKAKSQAPLQGSGEGQAYHSPFGLNTTDYTKLVNHYQEQAATISTSVKPAVKLHWRQAMFRDVPARRPAEQSFRMTRQLQRDMARLEQRHGQQAGQAGG
jgi:hypothetical protein